MLIINYLNYIYSYRLKENMASFFRGAAQSTPFQQAIEKITDGNQPTEDWGTIMKICDHVALNEEK